MFDTLKVEMYACTDEDFEWYLFISRIATHTIISRKVIL